MKLSWIRLVFWLSALYDLVLGIAFLVAAGPIFAYFDVVPPNHLGYVHFPAVLLIIFAVMYGRIALDPGENRAFIPYGIGLKAAFSGVALFHNFTGGIPSMWMPFAYIDLAFLIVFVVAWRTLKRLP